MTAVANACHALRAWNLRIPSVLFMILMFFGRAESQNLLRSPESVVYDFGSERYLVSNAANGQIISIDADGNQSYFNTDQSGIRGLLIIDDRLFAASNDGVAVIELASGNTVTTIPIPGAVFLNDLAADASGNLYVSDTDAGRIKKVRLDDYSVSTFVGSGISSPNGLLFDQDNNRLLLCSFRNNSPIQAIDLADSSVSVVVSTTYDNLDGLARDNLGNIYVSSWGSGSVYRYDSEFENPPERVSYNHDGPADIFYNLHNDILAVPNFNSNRVQYVPMMFGSIVRVPQDFSTIQDAIDAASYGDTVLVAEGSYEENINFRGKRIVVASEFILSGEFDNIDSTRIVGSPLSDPDSSSCVTFCSGEGGFSSLEGFTITGGTGTVWIDPNLTQYTWRGGGGIFIFRSSPTIRNNRIIGNSVRDNTGVDGAQGGGLLSYDGNPEIVNNIVSANEADYGAGIVMDYSGGLIHNNIIAENEGGEAYGGGGFWSIGNGSSPILIENNTIVGNVSTGSGNYGGKGGALFIWMGTVTVRNNIIWGNTQSQGGPIAELDGGTATVRYSDVQGGFPGTGNISEDPLFFEDHYILGAGSPCIDAGDTSSAYNDLPNPGAPDSALWPSMGGLRNDMGVYGGPDCRQMCADTTVVSAYGKAPLGDAFNIGSYPSPVNSTAHIEYFLAEAGDVTLNIYDLSGKKLETLVDGTLPKGPATVMWEPANLSSGTYLLRLSKDGQALASKTMTYVR